MFARLQTKTTRNTTVNPNYNNNCVGDPLCQNAGCKQTDGVTDPWLADRSALHTTRTATTTTATSTVISNPSRCFIDRGAAGHLRSDSRYNMVTFSRGSPDLWCCHVGVKPEGAAYRSPHSSPPPPPRHGEMALSGEVVGATHSQTPATAELGFEARLALPQVPSPPLTWT